MMNWFRSSSFFLATAVVTSLLCGVSISKRIAIENENNLYAIAAEADTLETLASTSGKTLEEAAGDFKQGGVNAVVLSEQTIGELISEGRLELVGLTLQKENSAKSLRFIDQSAVARVVRGLSIRFGGLVRNSKPRDNQLALPPVDAASIRSTSIGLDPRMVKLAKDNGFIIIARCSNPLGITSKAVQETITWTNEMGATIFLAQGDQVLGRRDATPVTIETLKSFKMLYASPEFAKLGGDVDMLSAMPDQVVRLHSAQAAELDKLSTSGAIERYRKAARERNMRVLLVRPLSSAADRPITAFTDFTNAIQQELVKEKLKVGTPIPYRDPSIPRALKALIGIAGALAAIWVASQLISGNNGLILGAIGGLIIAAGSLTSGSGLQIATLLLTLVFPTGAYFWLMSSKQQTYIALPAVILLSMVGGLCVAGLLNSVDYYIRAETFSGVKISVFLPIAIIGFASFAALNNLKTALKEPITWGTAGLGLILLAVLGFMLMRTGNDNPNAVSGGELAFRGLLEQLLPVRPRTKDFLIGIPALVVAINLLVAGDYDKARIGKLGGWTALMLMLGGIAMTDVVNTMCHLHTPVVTSLFRNIEGLVLGAVIGSVLWLVAKGPLLKHLEVANG